MESSPVDTYDVAVYQKISQAVHMCQFLYPLVDVLGMQTVVLQTANYVAKSIHWFMKKYGPEKQHTCRAADLEVWDDV